MAWTGWNTDNVFDWQGQGSEGWWDLKPLAGQIGVERDQLANERDAFLNPYKDQYNQNLAAQGSQGDATDLNTFQSQDFQNFVRSGQMPAAQPQAAPLPANATPTQQWNAQPTPQPMPTASPAMPTSPAPNTGPTAGTGDRLIQLLMERAQQPTAASRTDPTVRAQADAYSANVDRAARNYVSDVAEREGPYGNIEGYRRMAAEKAGQASGAFEAELLGREQDARRQEQQFNTGQWAGLLSGDLGMGLTRELGYMGNAQRTADRNTSMDQFLRELALREFDTNNRWDFNWMLGGGF